MKESGNPFDIREYQIKRGQVPRRKIANAVLIFDIIDFSIDTLNDNALSKVHNAVWETLEPEFYWSEKETHSSKNDLLVMSTGNGYCIAISYRFEDHIVIKI